jgi:hypothetical protein
MAEKADQAKSETMAKKKQRNTSKVWKKNIEDEVNGTSNGTMRVQRKNAQRSTFDSVKLLG